MSYEQSRTLAEVQSKHPFPWKEQRAGNLVRLVDANLQEVVLFEITAMAVLASKKILADQVRSQSPGNEVQDV